MFSFSFGEARSFIPCLLQTISTLHSITFTQLYGLIYVSQSI